MHGLAHYATRLGIEPKNQPTRKFSQLFWDNLAKKGRINELWLGIDLYFMDGIVNGIKVAMGMAGIGLGMLKAGRLSLKELIGGHTVKDRKGFNAMIKKAMELEAARVDK
jgi:quinone-modifying oxidoreductase subunit QmoC